MAPVTSGREGRDRDGSESNEEVDRSSSGVPMQRGMAFL